MRRNARGVGGGASMMPPPSDSGASGRMVLVEVNDDASVMFCDLYGTE